MPQATSTYFISCCENVSREKRKDLKYWWDIFFGLTKKIENLASFKHQTQCVQKYIFYKLLFYFLNRQFSSILFFFLADIMCFWLHMTTCVHRFHMSEGILFIFLNLSEYYSYAARQVIQRFGDIWHMCAQACSSIALKKNSSVLPNAEII